MAAEYQTSNVKTCLYECKGTVATVHIMKVNGGTGG